MNDGNKVFRDENDVFEAQMAPELADFRRRWRFFMWKIVISFAEMVFIAAEWRLWTKMACSWRNWRCS